MNYPARWMLLLAVAGCGAPEQLVRPEAANAKAAAPATPHQIIVAISVGQFALGTDAEATFGVYVLDSVGRAISGLVPNWVVDSGGGTIIKVPGQDTTFTQFYVRAIWKFGDTARRHVAHVEVGGVSSGMYPVLGAVGRLEIRSGNNQRGRAGKPLPDPIVVKAFTAKGIPLGHGFPVIFRPLDRAGNPRASDTTLTDANGLATLPVPWTLDDQDGGNRMTIVGETFESAITATATGVVAKPEQIVLVSGGGQRGTARGFLPAWPVIAVLDSAGAPMPGQPVEITALGPRGVTRSYRNIRTDARGEARLDTWRMGIGPGVHRIRVTTPGLPPSPITIEATVDSLPTPGFSITTKFVGVLPLWIAPALEAAAKAWERVIVGDLPAAPPLPADPGGCHPAITEPIDDVLVIVEVVAIDGPGGSSGDVTVCKTRPDGLPLVSRIRLDIENIVGADNLIGIETYLLHSLGHALGIGDRWDARPELVDGAGLRYLGQGPVQAFNWSRWAPDLPVTAADTVPLADPRHWSPLVGADIMAATLFRFSRITTLTAEALRELGYVVDAGAAQELVPAATTIGAPSAGLRIEETTRSRP